MPTVPIVPTEELQGGGFQPFSVGGEIAPMRDVAGRQAQEMGQSMVNAGQVLGSIANKMQDQMDDAATKQADVTFLTKAQDILWGEKGYLNTLGAGAADPSSVNAALIEAQKEVEKGLTNDVQRMMFGQSASRNMLNFSGKIAEHRFKQTTDYAAGESKSRADRYTMEAANNFDSIGMVDAKGNPTGPYNTAVNTALQEANAAADLMMLPPDSEQRKAMVRGVYGNVASGVVNNLMVDGRYLEAKSYIDSVVKQGQLDPADAMKLTSAIDAGYDRQRGIEVAKGVLNGNPVGGTPSADSVTNAVTTIVPGAQVKVTGKQTSLQSGGSAFQLIAGYEGLRLEPYWDVNHHRVGYGSDTVTKADGTVVKTTPGMRISKGDADRDLNRRVAQTQTELASAIGPAWESLPDGARAALTSVAYNYGSLPQRVVAAAKSGAPGAIAEAITNLSSDNGGINARRRREEAAVALGKAVPTRDYHISDTGSGGFQTIQMAPINGMSINDTVKLMRAKGFEVADINDMSQQEGTDPVWHMAVKLPSQMIGNREGGVTVPTLPDGTKDLVAMEKAVRDQNLDPDQEETALQYVRQQYARDKAVEEQQYNDTLKAAQDLAWQRDGGWQDVQQQMPGVWGKLSKKDRATLMQVPRADDPDTVLEIIKNPQLMLPGNIEKYRSKLSVSTYQEYVAKGLKPDEIRSATFDSDMFKNTLIKAGQSALLNSSSDSDKDKLIGLRDKFSALIDDEQKKRGKELSRTEKQNIIDGMMMDQAYIDRWGVDAKKPSILISVDERKNAYVVVGNEDVKLAEIPANQREKIILSLEKNKRQVTEQAIAEWWVKAGKPQ